jgi:amidase
MIRALAAALAAVLLAGSGVAHAAPLDPSRATIGELQAAMQAGSATSESLTRYYLARIQAMDHAGPGLHAVIAINPDAVAQAQALDRERRTKGPRGPLHGVPIILKDNIETTDPIPTTAGSLALAQNFAGQDAPLVARLRAAGAVILGKANLSEWANFRSDHSISGWSAVGGLVRNPYALDRSACGSSAGSAAAVAAGFAAAAVGTETDGSITCPSSMNGVVGLKPTLNAIPAGGVVPIAHSQDTPGPITRSVADAAAMFWIMSATPAPPVREGLPDLHGKRLGVLRFSAAHRPDTDPVYEAALARLKAAGAELVEVQLPDSAPVSQAEVLVLGTEFKNEIDAYLAARPPAVKTRSLADLIAFDDAEPREHPLFGQETFRKAVVAPGEDNPIYRDALARSKRLAGPEGIDKVLADHHLDALVAPTTGPAWRIDLTYGDRSAGSFSTFPAVAGYPHLTLPMGQVRGMPIGLSFIGTAGSEAKLLDLAAAFERTGKRFVAPTFAPTLDVAP